MMQSNAFSNAFITSTGIAEPPETHTRRLSVSASSWPGALSIAWYIVGTPSRIVTSSRAMISSALRGSNRGISVRQAPCATRGVEPARLPEGVEQRQRAEDHVLVVDPDQRARGRRQFSRRLSCVSSAPFGVPVVPDV